MLPNVKREYYFRAAIHRYAALRRMRATGRELETTREIAEAALVSKHTVAQIYAVTTLSALFPDHARELMPRFLVSKASPAIFVAAMQPVADTLAWIPAAERPDVDTTSVLLPAILGSLDYSALAAAAMRRMDGPLPLMPPAR